MVGFTIRKTERAKLSRKIYINIGIKTVWSRGYQPWQPLQRAACPCVRALRSREWEGRTGTGTGKWRDRRNHGGQRGEEYEKDTLVGDVQEYWGFYSGEGTDTVWDL